VKILKRAFIFLPGALYLFFGMLTIFSFDFLWSPASALIVFLIGSFMTIFGIGNLKNPKHLAIPLSICAISIAAYTIFSTFGGLRSVFEYGVYFFPLALISSFLAKSLVDKIGTEEN
jgi:peptidoglycan/LPS O-acetylase OafA/YrhL